MADIYHFDKKKDAQTMISADSGKRSKEQYIENIREGDVVNDFFAVKQKNPPRSYKKGTWFDILASDKTGEIGIKYWGGDNKDRVKRLYDSFNQGDIIQVRLGYVEVYDERMQISINETTGGIRRCAPTEYDVLDFIPSLEKTRIKELFEELQTYIQTIKNPQIQALFTHIFSNEEFVQKYQYSPSAVSHHHNYLGGNLEHSVGVLRLCVSTAAFYPSSNKDLLLAGAILHDVGKLEEYGFGTTIDKTDEGNFIGHIVIGDRWLRQQIQQVREKGDVFEHDLETQLCHILLSHHGKYEYGSPQMPKTLEACIVHQADMMDSQVKFFMQSIQSSQQASDDNWGFMYDSDLGRRRPVYLKSNQEKKTP